MEFLSQILPIIIYLLLIVAIIVGIVLGIKLIITLDKAINILDDVEDKVNKVTPIFNALGTVSNKFNDVVMTVVGATEKLLSSIFLKNRNKVEMEDEEDE